jgi:hypothetical protein
MCHIAVIGKASAFLLPDVGQAITRSARRCASARHARIDAGLMARIAAYRTY